MLSWRWRGCAASAFYAALLGSRAPQKGRAQGRHDVMPGRHSQLASSTFDHHLSWLLLDVAFQQYSFRHKHTGYRSGLHTRSSGHDGTRAVSYSCNNNDSTFRYTLFILILRGRDDMLDLSSRYAISSHAVTSTVKLPEARISYTIMPIKFPI